VQHIVSLQPLSPGGTNIKCNTIDNWVFPRKKHARASNDTSASSNTTDILEANMVIEQPLEMHKPANRIQQGAERICSNDAENKGENAARRENVAAVPTLRLEKTQKLAGLKILMHTIVAAKLDRLDTERARREEEDWMNFQIELRREVPNSLLKDFVIFN
jgi:hypothetical protein